MKTIKQIADEIGVSVQTVYRKLNSVKQEENDSLTEKSNGITYITADGENFLKDALSSVKHGFNTDKQEFNAVKQAENEIIPFLTSQIEQLQNELSKEREHKREQFDRIADLAAQLAELNRNNQILLKQEQDKNALPPASAEADVIEEFKEKEKQPFLSRLFKRK